MSLDKRAGREQFCLMRFLALLLAALLALSAPDPAHAETEVDVELFLAVDVSRSMSPNELEIQRRGYAAALRSPQVADAVRGGLLGRIALTYVEWAGGQYEVVPWTLIETADDLDRFAGRLTAKFDPSMRRTSISGAIDHAVRSLQANGFRGMRRVIDVSGDGPNNQGRPVEPARDEALAQGIVINGLPLMTREGMNARWNIDDLDEYYRRCVIGGPASFVIPVTRWDEFPRAVRQKLVQELVRSSVVRVQFEELEADYDCMVGERMWQRLRRSWEP